MEHIRENLQHILTQIPKNVRLIAVSKTQNVEKIREIYENGHKIFGENKVQELLAKQPLLPNDVEWHFIGHLQTNKVKFIAPFIAMIQSVDSLKLLSIINNEALKNQRVIKCLLQFHIAKEETKFGFDMNEAKNLLISQEFVKMKNIEICGVMGIATFSDNENLVKSEFKQLFSYFCELKTQFFSQKPNFTEISIGMSDDFVWAIESGSTMLRIGSAIFGKRDYAKKKI